MVCIPTIKESLDLLFAYGEEIYKRDLNEELKRIYSKSINKQFTQLSDVSNHSRDEILDELKTRYD